MAGRTMNFASMLFLAQKGHAAGCPDTPLPSNTERNESEIQPGNVNLGSEQDDAHRKSKKKRPHSKAAEGAIPLSEDEAEASKRSRYGKDQAVKLPKLKLNGLTVVDYNHYKEDPLGAASDVCKAAVELLKKFKRGESDRLAGLKKERDEAVAKAKEVKEALDSLTIKSKSLELSEAKSKKDAEAKVGAATQKIKDLEGAISQLWAEVRDLKLGVDDVKKQKEEAEEDMRICAQEGVRIAREQFDNALAQVQLCNPEVVIDKKIFDVMHVVLGDQIVQPGGNPNGTTLVVYQRPA